MESTHALTLTPPPPVSSFFNKFFLEIGTQPPPDVGFGAAGENKAEVETASFMDIPMPDLTSETTTFWLVIYDRGEERKTEENSDVKF